MRAGLPQRNLHRKCTGRAAELETRRRVLAPIDGALAAVLDHESRLARPVARPLSIGHQPRPAMVWTLPTVRSDAVRVTELDVGSLRKLGGSELCDLIPPHIVNAAHDLIGVNGHT